MSAPNVITPDKPSSQEKILAAYVEVWKTTIGTQQHFNDLELRIRNLAITLLGAILSGAALTLKDKVSLIIYGRSVLVAIPLIVVGLILWLVFYGMDRHWYHPLLIGSVVFGLQVENNLKGLGVDVALTETIGSRSAWKFKKKMITSANKMDWFYFLVVCALLLLIGFLAGSSTVLILVSIVALIIVASLCRRAIIPIPDKEGFPPTGDEGNRDAVRTPPQDPK